VTPQLTKGCKRVLEVLEKTGDLTSAQDIHVQLRSTSTKPPGLATVYRSLELLVSFGLAQAVDLGDGEQRYEVIEPGEHHHHLVCDRCRKSVHLEKCLVEDIDVLVKKGYDFETRAHVLEVFGLCSTCSRKDKKK
jgi:Fur family transcriptional regulator, ferric uptake regulator